MNFSKFLSEEEMRVRDPEELADAVLTMIADIDNNNYKKVLKQADDEYDADGYMIELSDTLLAQLRDMLETIPDKR